MPDPKVQAKHIITILDHQGYKFRHNVLNDRIDVNGSPITDVDWAAIRSQARDRGFKNMQQVEDSVIVEAFNHPYHPVKEWLSGQMGWDGTPYIQQLAGYFVDLDGVFSWLLEKWMIGAVAKIFTNGDAQNPMLVLDGKQNLGKSQFVWWLIPNILRKDFFFEGAIQPENKDYQLRLSRIWIWEVMELGLTLRKADREALKAFITLKQVTSRRVYGREDIVKPAMSSFIGTINNEGGFLTDPTGHRRFRPCHLTSINWDYATDIYQGDIWAEAYARYLMGETYKLTPQEINLLDPIRERYELIDPYSEGLIRYFDLYPGDESKFMTTFEILDHLQAQGLKVDPLNRYDQMQLSQGAIRLGLVKKKAQPSNLNGYFGLEPKKSGAGSGVIP